MEYEKGDTLELTLHGFSPDGRTVGRSAEGMTVFVQGGIPEQRVRVRLTAVKNALGKPSSWKFSTMRLMNAPRPALMLQLAEDVLGKVCPTPVS